MTFPPIDQLLPHTAPMVLLDELVEANARGCTCRVTVREDSLLFQDGGIPSFAGLEFMAQTIGAYSGYESWRQGRPVNLGFLIGTPEWESHLSRFAPGQSLLIRVHHTWGENELLQFDCQILDESSRNLLQRAMVNVYRPDNAEELVSRYQS